MVTLRSNFDQNGDPCWSSMSRKSSCGKVQWETTKSNKLVSKEIIDIRNISDEWLKSFGYRRIEEFPGIEFISKDLCELSIDQNDFKKYVLAYSAWDNEHQVFNDNDYRRLKLIRGEEEEYFDEQVEENLYWLQDQ